MALDSKHFVNQSECKQSKSDFECFVPTRVMIRCIHKQKRLGDDNDILENPHLPDDHERGEITMARLTYWEARAIASTFGFNPMEDFHVMSTGSKEAVIKAADSLKYRKPKNANGSRGRYFAAYVRRVIEKGED